VSGQSTRYVYLKKLCQPWWVQMEPLSLSCDNAVGAVCGSIGSVSETRVTTSWCFIEAPQDSAVSSVRTKPWSFSPAYCAACLGNGTTAFNNKDKARDTSRSRDATFLGHAEAALRPECVVDPADYY
jgi:hypothetical protein